MTAWGNIVVGNQDATGAQPGPLKLMGAPWWYSPLGAKVVHPNQDTYGPMPGPSAFLNGRVPAGIVPVIVSDFGSPGGGIWLI